MSSIKNSSTDRALELTQASNSQSRSISTRILSPSLDLALKLPLLRSLVCNVVPWTRPGLTFLLKDINRWLSMNLIFHQRQIHRTYANGRKEERRPVSRGISTRSISIFLDLALNALSAMICCVERGSMDATSHIRGRGDDNA